MRHTVIGLFDTYSQAENARDTLVQTGFASDTIELQANPVPSATAATDAVANASVLANIERFISSLFAKEPRPAEADRYAEAVRRGAVLVCVSAASESHAELAQQDLDAAGRYRHRRALARLGRGAWTIPTRAANTRCSTNSASAAQTRRPLGCPLQPGPWTIRCGARRPYRPSLAIDDPLTPQPPLSEAATLNTIAAGSAAGLRAPCSRPSMSRPRRGVLNRLRSSRFRTSISNMKRISALTTTSSIRATTRAMKTTCPHIATARRSPVTCAIAIVPGTKWSRKHGAIGKPRHPARPTRGSVSRQRCVTAGNA